MFTLLLGYILGLSTTYYFEEIFNYKVSSINLKEKFNNVLKNTVYTHIDYLEKRNDKQHLNTRDLVEDVFDELKTDIEKIFKLIEDKKQ